MREVVCRPVELEAAAQPLPDPEQDAMAGRLADPGMKRKLGHDAALVVFGVDASQQGLVAGDHLAPERLVAPRPHLPEGEALKLGADREDLAHVVDGKIDDMRARVRHGDKQAFVDQFTDCLAQESATNPQLLRVARLDHGTSRGKGATQDHRSQTAGDVLAECAAPYGLEVHARASHG
jgi:hypothetical protein